MRIWLKLRSFDQVLGVHTEHVQPRILNGNRTMVRGFDTDPGIMGFIKPVRPISSSRSGIVQTHLKDRTM
jgi:hypothetical protein